MVEKLITGKLSTNSIKDIPISNKIIFDDNIYNNVKPVNTIVSNNIEEVTQAIIEGLGFNPFPFPTTPYFALQGEKLPEILNPYMPTDFVAGYPDLSDVKIKFIENIYTHETDDYIVLSSKSSGDQNISSFFLSTSESSSIDRRPIYVGPAAIAGRNENYGIGYSYIIAPMSALSEDGKIIKTDSFKIVYIFMQQSKRSSGSVYYNGLVSVNYGNYSLLLNYKPEEPEPPEPETTDPYAPGGTSGTGGGAGSFDPSSDPVDFSQLPTLSAVNAGFISLFNPTNAELQGLAAKLWSTDFLDILTRFFSDPADVIISLSIVPVIPPVSGKVEVQAGFIPTGVTMNKITTQYVAQSCGSVEVAPFYDAALDYSPFTKLSVYLPFIGVRGLDVDECMGKTLAINYNIDLLSGSCVCEIKCADAVLYSFNGNVVSEIPISSRSFDTLIASSMQAVTSIGTAVATGGATAGASVSATANAIMSAKPEIIRSGNTSSMTGLLAGKTPYLIYQIPNQSVPENANTFTGYPSNISASLGELSGFTQVSEIHLDSVPGTDGELRELESLLKEGVIL